MAIEHLDQDIQQNASATEEMAATSEELASQGVQLRETASFFKIEGKEQQQRASNTGGGNSVRRQTARLPGQPPVNQATKQSQGINLAMRDGLDDDFDAYGKQEV